jgi:hypothetical protein
VGRILMQTNHATWRMLGGKLRDLMPVNAEVTNELQVLVLRLAVKEAERLHSTGRRRA